MDPMEIIRTLTGEGQEDQPSSPSDPATLVRLQKSLTEVKHTFKVGDLVTWKPGLRIHKFPGVGQPAVITEVLSEPFLRPIDHESGSAYWREPYDVKIGVIVTGDLVEYHTDSRRLQPYINGFESADDEAQ